MNGDQNRISDRYTVSGCPQCGHLFLSEEMQKNRKNFKINVDITLCVS